MTAARVRLVLCGVLALIVTGLFGAPLSHGAVLQITGNSMRLAAPAGEANDVAVGRSGSVYVVSDVVAIGAVAPCANLLPTVATCPVAAVTNNIQIRLNDGGDSATVNNTVTPLGGSGYDLVMEGGLGNDTLNGAPNAENLLYGHTDSTDSIGDDNLNGGSLGDQLIGGEGADTIRGGGGSDQIDGGAGNDPLSGGAGNDSFNTFFFSLDSEPDGADTFDGGTGMDGVGYNRQAPVNVSIDGVANDGTGCPGAGCEGDNVQRSIEQIGGSAGNDVLTGSSGRDGIFAGRGNDQVNSGGGDDFFLGGGEGRDVIRAGAGDDLNIDPGEDEDRVFGGAGDDVLLSTFFADDADDLRGGKGIDLVDYSAASNRVTVSLDGRANDGVPGEKDNVRKDVEDIIGTPNDDVLIGSKRPNDLIGDEGSDRISGGGGFDGLDGGRGNDRLSGGKNRDLIEGDAGRDRIAARDGGPDQVNCGSSFDVVLADRADRPALDCDKVKRKRRRGV